MRTRHLVIGSLSVWAAACNAQSADQSCQTLHVETAKYIVCQFDPNTYNVGLHLKNSDGEVYGDFKRLEESFSDTSDTMLFGMNAGMYHSNRDPVGLYIEDGDELQAISTKPGEGNFHMLPNGVFWIEKTNVDGVEVNSPRVYETKRYQADADNVSFATQSGPMLVIDGELHPRFLIDSDSRKIRNGVGIVDDGNVVFVVSDTPVNFYQFGSLFRDTLGAKNALYLDGTISRIYSKDLRRNDNGLPMGPIISVTQTPAAQASEKKDAP